MKKEKSSVLVSDIKFCQTTDESYKGNSLQFFENDEEGVMNKVEETIWEELDRFIGSIKDEIRSDDQDNSAIDFWVFKIKRRVDILHSALDKDFKLYKYK